MTTEYKIEVHRRELLGKQDVKKLRAEGKIPGIYYSQASNKSIPFYMEKKELHNAFKSDAHLYKVKVGGKLRTVIFKDIQYHPVTEEILHIDLYGVDMAETIDIKVPIHLNGIPKGVSVDGGHLTQQLMELDIRCLPSDIPDSIELDVTELRKGDSLHVGDLDIPENLECLTNDEVTVVSIIHGVRLEDLETAEEETEDITFEEEASEGSEEASE
jgi:large subunit ribosomal protein L25